MNGLTAGPANRNLISFLVATRHPEDERSGIDAPVEQRPWVGCGEPCERRVTPLIQPPTLVPPIQPKADLKGPSEGNLVRWSQL